MSQCSVTSFVDLDFYRFSVGTENLKKVLAEYLFEKEKLGASKETM